MNENKLNIGERIAAARKSIHLDVDELSYMTGLNPERIMEIEEEAGTPIKVSELDIISKHLYQDWTWFLSDTPLKRIEFHWCKINEA